MGACICCYSEGARVGKVLDIFQPVPASKARDNVLQKVVGRVVLASDQPFYAPVSGQPCVYFETKVREERIERRVSHDSNGNRNVYFVNVWYTIAVSNQFQNFYLQDGSHKVYVPGSRGTCRIQSLKGGGLSGYWQGMPPPGVQAMINQYFMARGEVFWGWGAIDGRRTGRYEYTERSFDVNELVAALGVPVSAQDPYTNTPCKIIQPFAQDTLTEEWMKENDWSLLQRKSWETLLKKGGAVLLSDSPDQVINVAHVSNLPQSMVAVAQPTTQYDGMYSNATSVQQVVIPQAQAHVQAQAVPIAQATAQPTYRQ
jgi:hypothetical protein